MKRLIQTVLCLICCFYAITASAIDLSTRPDIQAYIERISKRYHFNQAQLTSWFNRVDFLKITISKVKKPHRPTPYYAYRDAFLKPALIRSGVAYWKTNKATLLAAQAHYGIPIPVMIGILGIETGYGVNTGHHFAFQGLVTLAFHHPTRRAYFTSELTEYLLLCRDMGWNPLRIQSSFDGGLGLPQFMPSSYREYAVKTEKNAKKPNLFKSKDAIPSMGNYLRAKGWETGKPITTRAEIIHKAGIHSLNPKNLPIMQPLSELKKRYGIVPVKPISADLKASVVLLQEKGRMEYWLTFHNFKVIKKYNNSTYYAMTVYELGEAVHRKMIKKSAK